MSEWIPVTSRLPERYKPVQAYCTDINEYGMLIGVTSALYIGPNMGWDVIGQNGYSKSITHWQPLPEPPQT